MGLGLHLGLCLGLVCYTVCAYTFGVVVLRNSGLGSYKHQ